MAINGEIPSREATQGGSDWPDLPGSALAEVLNRCRDAIWLVEPAEGVVVAANFAARNWSFGPTASTTGGQFADWLPSADAPVVFDRLAAVTAGRVEEARFSCRLAGQPARDPASEFTARRIPGPQGALLAIVAHPSAIAYGAPRPPAPFGGHIDPLTGLADRAFLVERLTELVTGERADDQRCAVLFVDVDGFKQVNDAFGHLVGDRVLCEVARRLAASVRAEDYVVRFGGDEFVVLLERTGGREEIEPVVARIAAAFASPIEMPQGTVELTVSIGIAEADRDGTTVEALLDAADRSMYASKRAAAG